MAFAADEFTGRAFGKYEILCRLAVGGMAEIFLGFARNGPFAFKPLVLKRLLSDQREDTNAMRLLIDEARNTATLNHANVARVLDLEVTSEDVLLVIQYIDGANLEELVKACLETKEQLPVGFVLAVLRDAAQGLNHAHLHKDARGQPRPIVHRDVTPRNIMVGFDGMGRVLDFGIARVAGAESRTMAGMVRGTTAYMSPEQAVGQPPDHRSDLFSLGTLLHESLVGQRLFARENPGKEMAAVYEAPIPVPSQANRRVPRALDPVVMKLLERPVASRYQSATEFVRDLALAAGSSTWPPERCGEFVRERFAARQKAVARLLERVQAAAREAEEMTGSGRYGDADLDEAEPRTQIDRPLLARAGRVPEAIAGSTNTQPGLEAPAPRASPRRVLGEAPTDPNRQRTPPAPRPPPPEVADPALAGPGSTHSDDDEDDGGDGGDAGNRPTNFFSPGFDGAPSDDGSSRTRTGARRPVTVSLVLVALGATLVGAVGGALAYKAATAGKAAAGASEEPGVGRVSIASDHPAELQLGTQALGKTPLVDLYLPSGHVALRIRGLEEQQWRELVLNVKKDQLNRYEVKLDSLPQVP